jgi:hypothetical protein
MADNDGTLTEYGAKWWMKEIQECEKYLDDKWRLAADRVVNRYLDDRTQDDTGTLIADQDSSHVRKYNIFWANVQIMKSALYATPPKPAIKRQHDDAKDDVARVAAFILERIINFGLSEDDSDMHEAFDLATEDLLIPGLGQVWLRYAVETEVMPIPAVINPLTGVEEAPASEGMRIVEEEALTDYVHWRDFLFSVTRTWGEVWWVGRRCWMKKKAFVKRFGAAKWEEIKASAKEQRPKDMTTPKGFTKNRAEVFELWCEETNKAYWVSRHLDENLDEQDDPLKLENFYPCPKPLIATHTTNSFIPRSDYTMVADQYEELDILNARISILTKALRVVGVYDKTASELGQLLRGSEFNMVAVDNWAAFAEQGGLKGQVDWFPVDVIAKVLKDLMEQRNAVIAQIYELTSISDIMRGASNPRDTLGAQKLKAQYSSVRLQLRQQDVGKFVRAAIQLKCEIICRHWQPETIRLVSQIDNTESASLAEPAIALLKDYEKAEYRIEVGEETLSLADYNAERELRTQVLTSIGQFLSQAAQMMQGYPQISPYLFKMVQWVISSFKGSADIETVLDEAIKMAETNPPKDPNEQPDNSGELQMKMQLAQMTEQSKVQIASSNDNTRKEIAALQAQTTKDVAEMNNSTKVLIQEMADTLKLQVESANMQNEAVRLSMEQMNERAKMAHDAIMQVLASQQEGAGDKEDELKAIMKELTSTMSKKRVRVPLYGKDGNIERVEDSLEN